MLFTAIEDILNGLDISGIPLSRKQILDQLTEYIQSKVTAKKAIELNFICTHNSRRSHLGQVWAQTIASYYGIEKVQTYSGGTEATALFPKVAEILQNQGFNVEIIEEGENPLYAIVFHEEENAVLCFSKIYDHFDNPESDFAAIMTCDSANEACPLITGADEKIAITYIDPKKSDGTPQQDEVYRLKSLEIATELKYVFSQVNS